MAAGKKNAIRLGAHIVFVDESGFLLIPSVRRTWAPRGQTPLVWHRYRHDRISVISGISVSPKRRRLSLYFACHPKNITSKEVIAFLQHLLRHVRGHVILIWDRANIHRSKTLRQFCSRFARLHLEPLPGYAPELNPDEQVWSLTKGGLANGRPDNLGELNQAVQESLAGIGGSQRHLRACIHRSELPPFLP